jgi:hypothetical protein
MSGRWLVVVLLVGALAGCGGPVKVDVGAGSAGLGKGDVLEVNLGDLSPSIGDAWFVQTAPDPAVLADRGHHLSGCDRPGCSGTMTWQFAAIGKGTTTITFRYCYRSRLDSCDPGPGRGPKDPVRLSVTVR